MDLYEDQGQSPYRILPVAVAIVLALLCAILLAVWIIANGSDERRAGALPTVSGPQSDLVVVVENESVITNDYYDNIAAADARFRGKIVGFLMRGNIEQGPGGVYALTHYMPPAPIPGRPTSIHCYIDPKFAKLLAAGKGGEAVRLRGKCVGMREDKIRYSGLAITIVDCQVIELLSWRNGKWMPQ